MDPISAQGISQAFRDAELLSDATVSALGAGQSIDARLADYHHRRDAAARATYALTAQMARLQALDTRASWLMSAIADRPAEVERFLGVFAGAIPPEQLFSWRSVLRLAIPRWRHRGAGLDQQ